MPKQADPKRRPEARGAPPAACPAGAAGSGVARDPAGRRLATATLDVAAPLPHLPEASRSAASKGCATQVGQGWPQWRRSAGGCVLRSPALWPPARRRCWHHHAAVQRLARPSTTWTDGASGAPPARREALLPLQQRQLRWRLHRRRQAAPRTLRPAAPRNLQHGPAGRCALPSAAGKPGLHRQDHGGDPPPAVAVAAVAHPARPRCRPLCRVLRASPHQDCQNHRSPHPGKPGLRPRASRGLQGYPQRRQRQAARPRCQPEPRTPHPKHRPSPRRRWPRTGPRRHSRPPGRRNQGRRHLRLHRVSSPAGRVQHRCSRPYRSHMPAPSGCSTVAASWA